MFHKYIRKSSVVHINDISWGNHIFTQWPGVPIIFETHNFHKNMYLYICQKKGVQIVYVIFNNHLIPLGSTWWLLQKIEKVIVPLDNYIVITGDLDPPYHYTEINLHHNLYLCSEPLEHYRWCKSIYFASTSVEKSADVVVLYVSIIMQHKSLEVECIDWNA